MASAAGNLAVPRWVHPVCLNVNRRCAARVCHARPTARILRFNMPVRKVVAKQGFPVVKRAPSRWVELRWERASRGVNVWRVAFRFVFNGVLDRVVPIVIVFI